MYLGIPTSSPRRLYPRLSSSSSMPRKIAFWKTARDLVPTFSDNPAPIPDGDVNPDTPGQVVDTPSEAAISAIKTALATLKDGSALAAKIPFIAPVAGLLLGALTMWDEVKLYKKEFDLVMQKLTRIADIIINVGGSCEEYGLNESDLPTGLRTILRSLERELGGVICRLRKCAEVTRFEGFVLRNELLTKIKQCDGDLSNILQAFQAKMSLDTRFALIAAGQEIAAHLHPTEDIQIIPREPNVPQIFFGRDNEINQIVHMVFSDIASHSGRIAILGPGGYGKTTLANAVLTHERVLEHFGDARYFVTCESTSSSEALLIELGKTLGALNGAPNALWSRICTKLNSRESILCLDNFESPWDQSGDIKHSVEEVLSRITSLQRVTILITMRGVERPARTQWSQPFLEPLGTFGHAAAKQVWQAIAGNYDEFSEKLNATVDYVPLAVDLLAHLSQMTPPMLLWEEWHSKQTKVIQTGQMHRLSNLEYSIQLSIDSERMKANLSAKHVLGVLSMLP
ncbi:P-loop containing nucleoside triphosphate hydrolase protein, partial [Lactarius quietus]